MKTINLNIKNMVCPRCILVIQNELQELGATVSMIQLGHATIQIPATLTRDTIASRLKTYGFELLEDKEKILLEQIKLGIQHYIELLESSNKEVMLSDFLAHEIGKNYNSLSKLFSKAEGLTIETYYINKRIDRVKELVQYDELNLSEIGEKLGYSSVHYLSSQFKRVTGLSVSDYKEVIKDENRYYRNLTEALDDLREKGYTYNFNRKEDCLECKDLCTSFQIEDLNVSEFYRFAENEDPTGKSVIYGIETKDGLKGLLIDNSNLQNKALFKKLSNKLKEASNAKK
ncbi:AraC family transcriptional regulator [Roseivirga seohaensis]|uniref:AraC family transcriptional regulator n=1 Tax=Roseivirga seohaensis TaxID=1914963 RepID=A0A150XKW3_9BACT|nr:AraC family transcriptional regulator [Roseivirga seohaensis]KYG79295.1 AraC family transcriptional regulator [Roseivirga seohaensis]|tara:strand:- start:1958 stop:2818 length:861 start_codon:yes stop_codon:yes gene_type:complete